jgi:hypothetical protein
MLLTLWWSPPAEAQQALAWSLTETMVLEWHGETDGHQPGTAAQAHDRDNYLALKNRTNLGLRQGPLNVTFRFDQASYWRTCPAMAEEPTITDVHGCRSPQPGQLHNDYRLDRATARLRLGRHRLWVGDFPLQVARGTALSLRQVSEFGIDDALRGGRLLLRLHRRLRVDLFGGVVNISNLDEVTDRFVPEVRDRLAGGRIEGKLGLVEVGAHALVLSPLDAEGTTALDYRGGETTVVGGATVELSNVADVFSFYMEADGLLRWLPEAGEAAPAPPQDSDQRGLALYATADARLNSLTLLGELKWYENFEVAGTAHDGAMLPRPYNQPATIEREDQPLLDNTNVLGGRLRLDLRVHPALLLYANGAYVAGRQENKLDTLHSYAGLEYRLFDGRLNGTLSGGYRRVTSRRDDGEKAALSFEIGHIEANAAVQIHGPHSLHLAFRHETWNKPNDGEAHRFHRGSLIVGYDLASKLSLGVAYEYDTQFALNYYIVEEQEGRYSVPTSIRQHFVFGEVRYTPWRWLDLRLRGGTQRGGLRCLSGVCRTFPNFTGIRLETVLRF